MIKGIIILPRKAVRDSIISLGRSILKRKFIADPVKNFLRKYPRLFHRLDVMMGRKSKVPVAPKFYHIPGSMDKLSPREQRIYMDITHAIKKNRKIKVK